MDGWVDVRGLAVAGLACHHDLEVVVLVHPADLRERPTGVFLGGKEGLRVDEWVGGWVGNWILERERKMIDKDRPPGLGAMRVDGLVGGVRALERRKSLYTQTASAPPPPPLLLLLLKGT